MKRGVILFGHGSRDPGWRRPMDEVARRIAQASPDIQVVSAFLELEPPDLHAAIEELCGAGVETITVFPVFFGIGKHAREDLPRLLAQARALRPGIETTALPAAGEHAQVLDLLAKLAVEAAP